MAERTTEELVYEYWDCAYCESKGIRGDNETCSSCGHPRDQNIEFYRKDEAEAFVSDAAQAERFEAGPDWVCSFCETLNSQQDPSCKSCGASKDSSEKNFLEHKRQGEAKKPAPAVAKPPPPKPRRRSGLVFGIVGAVVASVVGFVFWAGQTHEVAYQVSSVHWERTIPVERYAWSQHVDWDDELKGDDIQRLSEREEVRRTEKRQVGTRTETFQEDQRYQSGTREECKTTYESTGSGASKKVTKCKDVPVFKTRKVSKTRQVPVHEDFDIMGNKVTYRSKAFVPHETRVARGDDNAPKWPDPQLGSGEDGKADREGARTETYEVDLAKKNDVDGPDPLQLSTTESRFSSHYTLGREFRFQVSRLGSPTLPDGDEVR